MKTYKDISERDSGWARMYKEDGSYINWADVLESIYVDDNHRAISIIDHIAKHIIDGDTYRTSIKISGLISTATSSIQIDTGTANNFVSNVIISTSGDDIDVILLEGPTLTTGTTEIPSYNMNRNSAKTAETILYSDPSDISGGIEIETLFLPGSAKKTGGAFESQIRWILKPNTTYVRRITNNTNAAIDLGVVAEFFEFGV